MCCSGHDYQIVTVTYRLIYKSIAYMYTRASNMTSLITRSKAPYGLESLPAIEGKEHTAPVALENFSLVVLACRCSILCMWCELNGADRHAHNFDGDRISVAWHECEHCGNQ